MNLLDLAVRVGVEDDTKSGFASILGGAASMGAGFGIASTLVQSAMSVVSSSIGSAVKRVDTLNKFPTVMQQMGFSAEESSASINKLNDGVQGLPTSLDSIAATAKNLALLTGDLSGATDVALALNNAFLASGSSADDASRGMIQYSQMLAKGKPDIQSWRTLQETMGYALRVVAEEMGYVGSNATTELYSALMAGEATFDEFNAKLIEVSESEGGLADQALEASSGIETGATNAKNAVVRNVGKIIDAFNDSGAIEKFFSGMSKGLDAVGSVLEPFASKIGEVASGIIDALDEVDWEKLQNDIKGLEPVIFAAVGAFAAFKATMLAFGIAGTVSRIIDMITASTWGLNAAMLANPIVLAVAAIGALVGALVWWFTQTEEGRKQWDEFTKFVGETAESVAKFFTEDLPNAIDDFATAISDFVTNLPEKAQEIATGFCDAVVNFFMELPGRIAEALGLVIGTVIGFYIYLGTLAIETGAAFVGGIVQWFQELPSKIGEFLTQAIDAIAAWAITTATQAVQAGSDFINAIVQFFSQLPTNIANFVSQAIQRLAEFVTSAPQKATEAGSAFVNSITNKFNEAVSFMTSIPGRLVGALGDVGSLLYGAGKSILDGFLRGLKAGFESAKSFVSGIAGWIADHKGPIDYDRKLLIPAGAAIMQGLYQGLDEGFSDVQSLVSGMAGELAGGFDASSLTAASASFGSSYGSSALSPRDDALIGWLSANLGSIIEQYAPTATPREFGRMVRAVS